MREREGRESIYSELVAEECWEEEMGWGKWRGGGGEVVVLTDGLCEGSCGIALRFLQVYTIYYVMQSHPTHTSLFFPFSSQFSWSSQESKNATIVAMGGTSSQLPMSATSFTSSLSTSLSEIVEIYEG